MFDSRVVKQFKKMLDDKNEYKFTEYLITLSESDKEEIAPIAEKVMRKNFKLQFTYWYQIQKYYLSQLATFATSDYQIFKECFKDAEVQIKHNICLPEDTRQLKEYFSAGTFSRFKYVEILECLNCNCYQISEQVIAETLARTYQDIGTWEDITFQNHLWLLFKYETNIHNQYEGSYYWRIIFRTLLDQKLLDRMMMIEESLLSTSRFNNRSITGFFFNFIEYASPTDTELIDLQGTLLTVLSSQHSKPINQTLKYLKRIYKEANFNLQGFMEQIPLLLSWDVKAIVNATLSLIDVLMKTYPKQKEELALLVVQTLGQEDESLQTKAVKLLVKHKLLETQSILDKIHIYSEGLYHSTMQLLPALDEVSVEEEIIEITPPQHIRDDNRIPTYETFDEMVFFFSQVFEGNNVYDFDLFVALLPKLHNLIDKNNSSKLEATFQRAFKSYLNSQDSDKNASIVIGIMTQAFLLFGKKYLNIYPTLHDKICLYYNEMVDYETNCSQDMHWYDSKLIDFDNIDSSNTSVYIIYQKMISFMFQNIENYPQEVPLSLPTHTPCWIDFETLIYRLKKHQNNSETIQLYDLEIALSRVILDKSLSTTIINNSLSGEFKFILLYLSTDKKLSLNQIETPQFWLTAILRKNNVKDAQLYTDIFPIGNGLLSIPTWYAYHKPWTYEIGFGKNKKVESGTSPKINIKSKNTVMQLPFDTIWKHTMFTNEQDILPKQDEQIIFWSTPSFPKMLVESILSNNISHWDGVDNARNQTNITKVLIELWNDFDETVYIYLAYTFIFFHKPVRTLASELWIKATNEGTMNHQLLGQTLGKLEHNEYAPLKRFTDLIVANMLNISTLHDQGLHTLLSNMITHMNDVPIKGTKKLLEIYLEVLSLTKLEVPTETLEKLGVWGEVKNLRVIIKKLKGV